MNLKIESQTTANREAVLTIQVETERLEKSQREAARRIAWRTRIPGFRAGKAPYSVVEQHVGEEAIFDEALEGLSREVYKEALDQTGLEPVAPAQVEVAERPSAGGVTLKMTVPLEPKVELGDYRQVRVKPKEVKVEEAEVEGVLEKMRADQGQWVPLERPAQNTDLLILDIEGRMGDKSVIDVKEGNYVLNLGSGLPVAGFPEMVEGMKAGDMREFDRTYPQDHQEKELAGRTVHFRVKVHGIKEKELPPLDDEFAKNFGDFAGLSALKERVRELLQAQKESEEEERIAEETLDAILVKATIEYPPVLEERELDHLISDYAHALSHQGFTLERYLEISGKSLETLRQELRPRAETRLKKTLILSQLSKEEGLEVEEGEVDQEIVDISAPYGDQAEAIKNALRQSDPLQAVRSRVLSRKAIRRLVEIGRGEVQEKKKGE